MADSYRLVHDRVDRIPDVCYILDGGVSRAGEEHSGDERESRSV